MPPRYHIPSATATKFGGNSLRHSRFRGNPSSLRLKVFTKQKSPAPQEQDFTFRPMYNYLKYYTASPHRRSPPYRTIARTSTTARH